VNDNGQFVDYVAERAVGIMRLSTAHLIHPECERLEELCLAHAFHLLTLR
jgi:hypothetical protein